MHSWYLVIAFGEPRALPGTGSPFFHFHWIRFLVGSASLLTLKPDLAAVKQPVAGRSPQRSTHAFPLPPPHTPALQVSPMVQPSPLSHAPPSGSVEMHASAASLQLSEQSPSPSPAKHGSPVCTLHAPDAHVSAPLQNAPSSHVLPLASWFALQVPEPSQVSGLSQASSALLPHGVVAASILVRHVPEPSQLSA